MDRPAFRFTDWYAVDSAVIDTEGNGLKYLPLSWNGLGLDVVETRRCEPSYEREAATAISFTKRKTSSRLCRPSPQAGRTWLSGTTKTRKSLLSRDQIAGVGGLRVP
jgi:hypothetical protein